MDQGNPPERFRKFLILRVPEGSNGSLPDFIEGPALFQGRHMAPVSQKPAHGKGVPSLAECGVQHRETLFFRKQAAEAVFVALLHLLFPEHRCTEMVMVLSPACIIIGQILSIYQESLQPESRNHIIQGAFPPEKGKTQGLCPPPGLLFHRPRHIPDGSHTDGHGRLKSLPSSVGVNLTMVGLPWGHTKGRDVWKRSVMSSFICRIFRGSPRLMAPRQAA